MEAEINALEKMETFDLIPFHEVPDSEQVLPSRFVFTTKRSGKIKSRLVAGGHKEETSVFQGEDGSPTLNTATLNLFLINAVEKNFTIKGLDFNNAYLQSFLPKPIYMKLPAGFTDLRPESSG